MDGFSIDMFPQENGATHVLLRGLVLGAEKDPLPKLLTELAAKHELAPEKTCWYECWHQNGWGQLVAAWRENRCIRVDWKPINPDMAEGMVRGTATRAAGEGEKVG